MLCGLTSNAHVGAQVMRTQDARRAAREYKMDLVEVDPRTRPAVCKLLEAGKAAYQAAQKDKVTRGWAK